jgi:hypothetical protein
MALWPQNLVAGPMLARLLAPAALLALGACSAAMPGYSPPPFKESKSQFGKPLASGDMQGERYEMSSAEKAMDCKRLTGSMQITMSRLRDAGVREAPSAVASAAQTWASPVLGGSGRGSDREAVYARERAKLDAYNAELAAKGCKTLDVEAELARPPEPAGQRY